MKTRNDRRLIMKGIGRRYRAAMDRWDFIKADALWDFWIELWRSGWK